VGSAPEVDGPPQGRVARVPKKVHNRPAKSKARPRRPVTTAPSAPSNDSVMPGGAGAEGTGALPVAALPETRIGASPLARPAEDRGGTTRDRNGTTSAARTRRGPAAARRTPTLVVNYQYLRRDIRSLSILAPTMIVLLIIAFFVLH